MLDELVERVIEVDRSPDLLVEMLRRPWLRGNRIPRSVDDAVLLGRFTEIFETPIDPVATLRGLGRAVGLDRLPDAAGSIRRRLLRKWRQWTSNA